MPPIQRVVDVPAASLHPEEFRQELTAHKRPHAFLRPLEHSISVDGGGLVTGVAKPVVQRAQNKPAASRAQVVSAGIKRFVQRVTFGPETPPPEEEAGEAGPTEAEVPEAAGEPALPPVQRTTPEARESDERETVAEATPQAPGAQPEGLILADRSSMHDIAPVQRALTTQTDTTTHTTGRSDESAGESGSSLATSGVGEPQPLPVAQRADEEHVDAPADEAASVPTLSAGSPPTRRDVVTAEDPPNERSGDLPGPLIRPRRPGLGPPLPTTREGSFAQRSPDPHAMRGPTPPLADSSVFQPVTDVVGRTDTPEPRLGALSAYANEPHSADSPESTAAPEPAAAPELVLPATPPTSTHVLGRDALTTTVQRSTTTPLLPPVPGPSDSRPAGHRAPSGDAPPVMEAPEDARGTAILASRTPLPVVQRRVTPSFEANTETEAYPLAHPFTVGASAPRETSTVPIVPAAQSNLPTEASVQLTPDHLTAQTAEESTGPTTESSTGPAAAGGGASGTSLPSKPGELDELARRLYGRIRSRLKTELRLDRERAGRITDLCR